MTHPNPVGLHQVETFHTFIEEFKAGNAAVDFKCVDDLKLVKKLLPTNGFDCMVYGPYRPNVDSLYLYISWNVEADPSWKTFKETYGKMNRSVILRFPRCAH